MKQLIVDYLPFEIKPEHITESIKENDGKLIVRGVLQRAEAKNQNGRVYPRDILHREAKKYTKEFISERRAMGELDHPESSVGEAKMIVAKKLKGGVKAITSVNRVGVSQAKQVDKKIESVTEGKYHDYRNDESLSPKQKIGYSMREVRDKLTELDKLVKMNVRFKNEVGVDSTSYWKNTHNAMKKISERLVKLANKVGQLY